MEARSTRLVLIMKAHHVLFRVKFSTVSLFWAGAVVDFHSICGGAKRVDFFGRQTLLSFPKKNQKTSARKQRSSHPTFLVSLMLLLLLLLLLWLLLLLLLLLLLFHRNGAVMDTLRAPASPRFFLKKKNNKKDSRPLSLSLSVSIRVDVINSDLVRSTDLPLKTSQGVIGSFLVLLGFYWVLLGFTWFYRVLLRFT